MPAAGKFPDWSDIFKRLDETIPWADPGPELVFPANPSLVKEARPWFSKVILNPALPENTFLIITPDNRPVACPACGAVTTQDNLITFMGDEIVMRPRRGRCP
jgi:hypothetical protein